MKLSSVSRLVSTRGLGAWGFACTFGLVVGCGDDEGGISEPLGDAAASSLPGDAAAPAQSTSEPAETSDEQVPVTTEEQGGDDEDAGGTNSVDAGGLSGCGGAGKPCCEETECGGGLVCVAAPWEPPAFTDSGAASDGGGIGDIIAILGDGGLFAFDGGIALPSLDSGIIEPPSTGGICEPCGAEGERCCAAQACNDGFSCEGARPSPNAPQTCVADEAPAVTDGGAVASPDAAAGDSGSDDAAGDAATECGGLDQPCCEGRGAQGVCGDGLECEARPPRGLEADVCVEG